MRKTEGANMKIYDISQEVFGCAVYPGDPSPKRQVMLSISEGKICNLTAFNMCAHNGTHVDAPFHFINEGRTIDQVDIDRFVGYCYVASHDGDITAEDANKIMDRAKDAAGDTDCYDRILVKGEATMTEEAAKVFADNKIKLFGNESQTVGPLDAPMEVHLIMLGAEIVLLEGIRLSEVPDGVYLLNSAPINLGGSDGAPCRAILMSL
jgi:arylformamidase